MALQDIVPPDIRDARNKLADLFSRRSSCRHTSARRSGMARFMGALTVFSCKETAHPTEILLGVKAATNENTPFGDASAGATAGDRTQDLWA